MTEKIQKMIDNMMLARYDASRSAVTADKWQKTSSNCWVCAYCTMPIKETQKPKLYMVHWTNSTSSRTNSDIPGITIVYKSVISEYGPPA